RGATNPSTGPPDRPGSSAERVPARAAARGVGVVDGEALLLDGVFEVDRGALEVGRAHLVDDHLDAVEVNGDVSVEQPLIEVELVDEARASTGLNGDTQAQIIAALLLAQRAHLCRGGIGQPHAVRGSLGGGVAHAGTPRVNETLYSSVSALSFAGRIASVWIARLNTPWCSDSLGLCARVSGSSTPVTRISACGN